MFLRLSTNSHLVLVLYSDDVTVDKTAARYFAVLYVAVPRFDMIGRKDKLSNVPLSFNL